MADVDPGDVLRIGAGMTFDSDYDIVNVWHVLMDNTVGTVWATAVQAVQTYMDTIYQALKVQLSNQVDSLAISIANATQATTIGTVAWENVWVGSVAGDPTAAGVCAFTWGRTYTPRVQIRKYFGVFGETGMTDGSWVGAVQAAGTAAMDYHIGARAIFGGWTLTGVAFNRTLKTHVFAVSSDTSAEPAYQRRRRRGRGS